MPRRRARVTALLLLPLFLLAGCASLTRHGGEAAPPEEVARALFPVKAGGRALRGEAEVTMAFGRRKVSLPAVFLFRAPDEFRFDLLDPFDRPAAVVFADGARLVQYQPAAAAAASLRPLPRECESPSPADWVAPVLGQAPRAAAAGSWRVSSLLGGPRLEGYEKGVLARRVDYRHAAGDRILEAVTWYCGEEVVLRLETGAFRLLDGLPVPEEFRVSFPQARMTLEFSLGEAELVDITDPEAFRPVLGAGVRWRSWALVQ